MDLFQTIFIYNMISRSLRAPIFSINISELYIWRITFSSLWIGYVYIFVNASKSDICNYVEKQSIFVMIFPLNEQLSLESFNVG